MVQGEASLSGSVDYGNQRDKANYRQRQLLRAMDEKKGADGHDPEADSPRARTPSLTRVVDPLSCSLSSDDASPAAP